MQIYNTDNIFAKIIRKEIPCNPVYEDEKVLAFYDIHPAAPVHIIVIPKGNYISFDDFIINSTSDEHTHFFRKVREIAAQLNLTESGYRLITNHGSDASQTVPHFHVHILGKRKLGALVSGDTHHA
jgi:histidine triad (HIT) family protein